MDLADKARQVSTIFFIATGVILALTLTIFALWPDFEAALFDTNNANGESLNTLRCPLLITSADEATIHLTLHNRSDRTVNFLTRANIARRSLTFMRQENDRATVPPGEKAEFAWSVSPEEAVYDRMILARVRVLRTNSLPARQKACGILVLNIPFLKGSQIIGGLLVGTLLSLGAGTILWLKWKRPLTGRKRKFTHLVGLLVLLLLLTMTFSLVGWWGSGLIIIVVMLIALAALIEHL